MSKMILIWIYCIAKKRCKRFYEVYLCTEQIWPSFRELLNSRTTIYGAFIPTLNIYLGYVKAVVGRMENMIGALIMLLCTLSQIFAYIPMHTTFH